MERQDNSLVIRYHTLLNSLSHNNEWIIVMIKDFVDEISELIIHKESGRSCAEFESTQKQKSIYKQLME